jgi:hypothetical protein
MGIITNQDIMKEKLLAVFKRTTYFPDGESVAYAKKVKRPTQVQCGDMEVSARKGDVIILGKDCIARVVPLQMIEKNYRFIEEDKVPVNFQARLQTLQNYLKVN